MQAEAPTLPVGSAARFKAYARLLFKSDTDGLDDADQAELAALSGAINLTDRERERDRQIVTEALRNEARYDGLKQARDSCRNCNTLVEDAKRALGEAKANKGRADAHFQCCVNAQHVLTQLRRERPILFETADLPRLIRE